jgi:hypothetical protein
MSDGATARKWIIFLLVLSVAGLAILIVHPRRAVTLKGAVLQADPDPNKQLPLADVHITAFNGLGLQTSTTDATGFFSLTLPKGLRRRQPVTLQFRLKGYEPLDVDDFISDKLYVARMVPLHRETIAQSATDTPITNERVRYSVKATTEANIGSAVKTFEVVNTGNVLCQKHPPCSPDGKWKAAFGSLSLDAGVGNEFRNPRVSCIAGPCAFTKVEQEGFSQDRRHFNVTVRDWSDTTTFLVEAEVVHPMTSDMVRLTYPVVFGRALNFSLPSAAEGPSIEADVKGEAIVFPLGPDLFLRWANCHMMVDKDQSRNYRCELKRGYQFR